MSISGAAWYGHNTESGTCQRCQRHGSVRRGYNGGAYWGVTTCPTCIPLDLAGAPVRQDGIPHRPAGKLGTARRPSGAM